MNEPEKNPAQCPRCGAALPPNAPEGLCPRCVVAQNLAAETEFPTGEAGPHGTVVVKPTPLALPVAEIAKLFPQLEILEALGRGGMGAVYKARQPRLDRFVALKILSPEKEGLAHFGDRFEREARTLARLHHPNIVTVYEFGEVDGRFYLLMEFVDGLTLRQLLQTRKLSADEALAIVPKICEALQYAHQQGIVHRDIKPENILLDKQGRVKIADFGIAKLLNQPAATGLTEEQQVIGTPHYMAPEQLEKPQEVDHRADIYSLGVVFYEMLTGELPLGKFAAPSSKVSVDVRLDEVVLHALEKEPARRYQRASDVKSDVETIASGGSGPTCAAMPPSFSAPFAAAFGTPSGTSDKTILPTFLLAFFFGVFGVHRFFVGKIGTGILQLATFGGCGVWATIDWIIILCGAFTDKEGRRISRWLHPDDRAPRPPAAGAGGTSTTTAAAPREPVDVPQLIKAPAVALLVVGALKIFSTFTGMLALFGLQTFLHARLPGWSIESNPTSPGAAFLMLVVMLIPSSLVIFGAVKMLRRESYPWAIATAILAILFPPLYLVGIPIAIWALVILCRADVRAAFTETSPTASPLPLRWLWIALAILALTVTVGLGTSLLSSPSVKTNTTTSVDADTDESEKTFPLTADGRFSLDNVNGQVEISGWDKSEVAFTAVKHGAPKAELDEVKIDVDSTPARTAIHTRYPKRSFWQLNNRTLVDYTLHVPRGARLDSVDTVNGEVRIAGVSGNIAASTVNGEVHVKDAAANLKLSSVNGELTAEILSLGHAQSISFSTVNGQITAELPADADANVSASTVNGSIESDFPELVAKKELLGKNLKGKLGDGHAKVKANAVNGEIHFPRRAAAAADVSADAPTLGTLQVTLALERKRLTELRTQYPEDHPELKSLREQIAALEQKIKAAEAATNQAEP